MTAKKYAVKSCGFCKAPIEEHIKCAVCGSLAGAGHPSSLSSAAPAMYEACKKAYSFTVGLYDLMIKNPVDFDKAKAVNTYLVEAIAKAEGKEAT